MNIKTPEVHAVALEAERRRAEALLDYGRRLRRAGATADTRALYDEMLGLPRGSGDAPQ